MAISPINIKALTPGNWKDFESLFGPKGAYGGCWCMWWRIQRSQFEKQAGESNRNAMRTLVYSGEIPGLAEQGLAINFWKQQSTLLAQKEPELSKAIRWSLTMTVRQMCMFLLVWLQLSKKPVLQRFYAGQKPGRSCDIS
jgi:hypothetical protein